MLATGDILLVAGKGHETGQIIGNRTSAFLGSPNVPAPPAGASAREHDDNRRPSLLWTALASSRPRSARERRHAAAAVDGISIDTRTLVPGDLSSRSRARRATARLCRRRLRKGRRRGGGRRGPRRALKGIGPLYVVHDVLAALQRLAQPRARARGAHRRGHGLGRQDIDQRSAAARARRQRRDACFGRLLQQSLGRAARRSRACRETTAFRRLRDRHEPRRRDHAARRHGAAACRDRHRRRARPSRISSTSSMRSPMPRRRFSPGSCAGGVAILNRDDAQFERLETRAKASPAGRYLDLRRARRSRCAPSRYFDSRPIDSQSPIAQILGREVTYRARRAGQASCREFARRASGGARFGSTSTSGRALASFQAASGTRPSADARKRRAALHRSSTRATMPIPPRCARLSALLGALPTGRKAAASPCSATCWNSGPSEDRCIAGRFADDHPGNQIDLVFAAGPLMKALYDALPAERRGALAQRCRRARTARARRGARRRCRHGQRLQRQPHEDHRQGAQSSISCRPFPCTA